MFCKLTLEYLKRHTHKYVTGEEFSFFGTTPLYKSSKSESGANFLNIIVNMSVRGGFK